jgi:hypothetical protein
VEHTGELDRDISSSDDSDPLGLFLNLEETVRVDSVRSSWDFLVGRYRWSPTDSDDDLLCLDGVGGLVISSDLDLVLVDEGGPTLVIGNAVIDQVLLAVNEQDESAHVD